LNGRTSVRSQQYRLDHQGALFNRQEDPGQTINIAEEEPAIAKSLSEEVRDWNNTVVAEFS
jgi:hypothetical protein